MIRLGHLLKRARTKYNCSLDALAESTNLDRDLLLAVEQDRAVPDQEVLDAYASCFRIDKQDIARLRAEYASSR